MKLLNLIYSAAVYSFFLLIFTYFVVFVAGDALVNYIPNAETLKTVDRGNNFLAVSGLPAIIGNLLLLLAFSLQHSVMARTGFKELLIKVLPKSAERSTFVLSTCLVLLWLYFAWQPMPEIIWRINGVFSHLLFVLFLSGASLVLWATFMISHWQLFGISQAWHNLKGTTTQSQGFQTPAMYKYSRHPMYLGMLFVLWATPVMTAGHLLFAIVMTLYIFVGVSYEEKDLITEFGHEYREYVKRVPKLIPKLYKF